MSTSAAPRPPAPSPDENRSQPRLIRPLADFFHQEASAGFLLVIAAALAMVIANSPWSDAYFDLWAHEINLAFDDHSLSLTLREWVNDGLMTVFFFVAGLEIKREVTTGELRDPRQASLPIIGAMGGMLVPALIYTALNAGGDGSAGWGIPMATDIAIVVGVVALLGSRVPSWLKLFLLALAIVDDIGAIVVIAIFYSDGVSFTWLAFAVAMLGVAAVIRKRVPYVSVYVLLGALCWFGLHEAHVHPTLAGVAFGMLAPVVPRRRSGLVVESGVEVSDARSAARLATTARNTVSVVEWLEFKLHPWSAFLVVPVFAFANAGIAIPASEIGEAMGSTVTWGVILGLVVGKTVGITAATLLAVSVRVGVLPPGVTRRTVIGGAALGGIGFTVSLFVTELAFGDSIEGRDARLGVIIASLLAATLGTTILLARRRTAVPA